MRTFVIRKVVIAPTGIRGIPKNVTVLPVTIPWKVLAPVAQPVRGVVQRAGVAGLKVASLSIRSTSEALLGPAKIGMRRLVTCVLRKTETID